MEVLSNALGGKKFSTWVEGPLRKKVKASWILVEPKKKEGRTALIEMARASGLALLNGKNQIMEATSTGTGQLIKAALDKNCKKIILGVGGTACSEGGAGALRALGFRYFDGKGRDLSAKPKDLGRLFSINKTLLDPRLKQTQILVLCDVKNPLLGPKGSARTFGPQKGATPKQVEKLEKILRHWAGFSAKSVKNLPGAGAAGALAFGLAAFAGAKLVPGTSQVMRALNWNAAARKADLIITGEGRLDKTSFQGKVVGEIIKRRGHAQVMVVCGSSSLSKKEIQRSHISRVARLQEFIWN